MNRFDPAEHQRLRELIDTNTNPYWATLGIEAREVHAPGHVVVGLPIRPAISNRNGVVHGGAIMSLIDAAGGGAARTLTRAGEPVPTFPTTDLNVSFVNPARGSITATGRVIRRGRSLVFVQVEVHDEVATLVASARATYLVLASKQTPA